MTPPSPSPSRRRSSLLPKQSARAAAAAAAAAAPSRERARTRTRASRTEHGDYDGAKNDNDNDNDNDEYYDYGEDAEIHDKRDAYDEDDEEDENDDEGSEEDEDDTTISSHIQRGRQRGRRRGGRTPISRMLSRNRSSDSDTRAQQLASPSFDSSYRSYDSTQSRSRSRSLSGSSRGQGSRSHQHQYRKNYYHHRHQQQTPTPRSPQGPRRRRRNQQREAEYQAQPHHPSSSLLPTIPPTKTEIDIEIDTHTHMTTTAQGDIGDNIKDKSGDGHDVTAREETPSSVDHVKHSSNLKKFWALTEQTKQRAQKHRQRRQQLEEEEEEVRRRSRRLEGMSYARRTTSHRDILSAASGIVTSPTKTAASIATDDIIDTEGSGDFRDNSGSGRSAVDDGDVDDAGTVPSSIRSSSGFQADTSVRRYRRRGSVTRYSLDTQAQKRNFSSTISNFFLPHYKNASKHSKEGRSANMNVDSGGVTKQQDSQEASNSSPKQQPGSEDDSITATSLKEKEHDLQSDSFHEYHSHHSHQSHQHQKHQQQSQTPQYSTNSSAADIPSSPSSSNRKKGSSHKRSFLNIWLSRSSSPRPAGGSVGSGASSGGGSQGHPSTHTPKRAAATSPVPMRRQYEIPHPASTPNLLDYQQKHQPASLGANIDRPPLQPDGTRLRRPHSISGPVGAALTPPKSIASTIDERPLPMRDTISNTAALAAPSTPRDNRVGRHHDDAHSRPPMSTGNLGKSRPRLAATSSYSPPAAGRKPSALRPSTTKLTIDELPIPMRNNTTDPSPLSPKREGSGRATRKSGKAAGDTNRYVSDKPKQQPGNSPHTTKPWYSAPTARPKTVSSAISTMVKNTAAAASGLVFGGSDTKSNAGDKSDPNRKKIGLPFAPDLDGTTAVDPNAKSPSANAMESEAGASKKNASAPVRKYAVIDDADDENEEDDLTTSKKSDHRRNRQRRQSQHRHSSVEKEKKKKRNKKDGDDKKKSTKQKKRRKKKKRRPKNDQEDYIDGEGPDGGGDDDDGKKLSKKKKKLKKKKSTKKKRRANSYSSDSVSIPTIPSFESDIADDDDSSSSSSVSSSFHGSQSSASSAFSASASLQQHIKRPASMVDTQRQLQQRRHHRPASALPLYGVSQGSNDDADADTDEDSSSSSSPSSSSFDGSDDEDDVSTIKAEGIAMRPGNFAPATDSPIREEKVKANKKDSMFRTPDTILAGRLQSGSIQHRPPKTPPSSYSSRRYYGTPYGITVPGENEANKVSVSASASVVDAGGLSTSSRSSSPVSGGGRQRYRRRGSVTKYSLDIQQQQEVQQQRIPDGATIVGGIGKRKDSVDSINESLPMSGDDFSRSGRSWDSSRRSNKNNNNDDDDGNNNNNDGQPQRMRYKRRGSVTKYSLDVPVSGSNNSSIAGADTISASSPLQTPNLGYSAGRTTLGSRLNDKLNALSPPPGSSTPIASGGGGGGGRLKVRGGSKSPRRKRGGTDDSISALRNVPSIDHGGINVKDGYVDGDGDEEESVRSELTSSFVTDAASKMVAEHRGKDSSSSSATMTTRDHHHSHPPKSPMSSSRRGERTMMMMTPNSSNKKGNLSLPPFPTTPPLPTTTTSSSRRNSAASITSIGLPKQQQHQHHQQQPKSPGGSSSIFTNSTALMGSSNKSASSHLTFESSMSSSNINFLLQHDPNYYDSTTISSSTSMSPHNNTAASATDAAAASSATTTTTSTPQSVKKRLSLRRGKKSSQGTT